MKTARAVAVTCVCLCTVFVTRAQLWVDQMLDDSVNFYTVQQSFNQYWQGKTIEKGKGWKPFKRWEWFMAPRVYPTGNRFDRGIALRNFNDYYHGLSPQQRSANGTWTPLGPFGKVPGTSGGAGRVNCIRFDPSNPSTAYAGAPAGGLWKTTNNGANWTLMNTDDLGSVGITDVAVDPANSNTLYIATGDADGNDTYSIGVMKSTDGGLTWNPTGLSWITSQGRNIRRLIIDPTNPQILLAATSVGIYRSTDAGASWVQTLSGGWRAMEIKPGDPNTVYIASTSFRVSTDGGLTFTTVSLPLSGIGRIAMAVTPANPAYVYLLASNTSDNGFRGLMRSTDSGNTFSTQSTTPNVLGWNSNGQDSGGQGWYDLAVAASHTNANEVLVGGVNIWRSTNGGTSWNIRGHWTGGGGADYIHADQHCITYFPGSGTQVWVGCDGGAFRSTNSGSTWNDISNDITIAQMYRLGVSQTQAGKNMTGWQDNGSNYLNAGTWSRELGGDGMECLISHSNSNTMYGSLYYGEIHRTTNGGGNWSTIVNTGGNGVDSDGDWVTPYVMSPTTSSTLYVGKSQVYKSTNSGTSWTQVGNISGGSGFIIALAVTAANSNYIYAAKNNHLWVTTNGSTFTDRTNGLPVASASITYIAVSSTNANKAWVTFSGYDNGNKVYMTTDAGVTWTNYSTGLPNLPANCIVYEAGSSDGLYVGMDIGVYYRNSSFSSWLLFNFGLPNTVVDELDIQYSSNKLRAATYGRGLWESDLFTPPTTPPTANFTADNTTACQGQTVNFTDISGNIPNGWSWNFGPNAVPATSTQQNPSVVFTQPGTYTITLTATNAFGNNTDTKPSYITVLPAVTSNVIASDQTICTGTAPAMFTGTAPGGGSGIYSYQWQRSFINATTAFVNITGGNAADYTHGTLNQDTWFRRIVNSAQCVDTSNVLYVDVLTIPTPVIQQNGTVLNVYGGYTYQWMLNGGSISGATDSFYVAQQDGLYTVTVFDTNGCSITSSPLNVIVSDVNTASWLQYYAVFPNPSNGLFQVELNDERGYIYELELKNTLGQVVWQKTTPKIAGAHTENIRLDKTAKGSYMLIIRHGTQQCMQRIVVY